jgi:hypothetical protein
MDIYQLVTLKLRQSKQNFTYALCCLANLWNPFQACPHKARIDSRLFHLGGAIDLTLKIRTVFFGCFGLIVEQPMLLLKLDLTRVVISGVRVGERHRSGAQSSKRQWLYQPLKHYF